MNRLEQDVREALVQVTASEAYDVFTKPENKEKITKGIDEVQDYATRLVTAVARDSNGKMCDPAAVGIVYMAGGAAKGVLGNEDMARRFALFAAQGAYGGVSGLEDFKAYASNLIGAGAAKEIVRNTLEEHLTGDPDRKRNEKFVNSVVEVAQSRGLEYAVSKEGRNDAWKILAPTRSEYIDLNTRTFAEGYAKVGEHLSELEQVAGEVITAQGLRGTESERIVEEGFVRVRKLLDLAYEKIQENALKKAGEIYGSH